jgi:hypothetical protein
MATEIFISYSHDDASYLENNSLIGHLKGLERDGARFWSDQEIQVGQDWDASIRLAIDRADISLVLVSQMFLNSKYCQKKEMSAFLRRSRDEGLIIFPVILSACDWEQIDWLRQRQFLPRNGKNIEEHFHEPGERKAIFQQITEALRKYVKTVYETKKNGSLPVVAMRAFSDSMNTVNRMYPQLQSFHDNAPEQHREYGIEPDVRIARIRLSDKNSRLHPRHVVPKPAQAYESEVPYEGKGDHIIAKTRDGLTTLTPADINKLSERQLRHMRIFQEELEESYDRWEFLYRRRRRKPAKKDEEEMRQVVAEMKDSLDRVFAFLKAANLQIDDHYVIFKQIIEEEILRRPSQKRRHRKRDWHALRWRSDSG